MPVALGRSPYWIGGILGGPFLFEGEVVVGDRRGRELGVPTAKIVPGDALVSPGHGAYAAWRTGIRRRSTWGFARRSRLAAACSWRHTFAG